MARLLLILGLVLLLGWWFFGRRSLRSGEPSPSDVTERPAAPVIPPELVACAHCGLRLPLPEALPELEARVSGQSGPAGTVHPERLFYCCEAHRQAGPAR